MVARSGGRGWLKWVKVVIRYKLSVISLGDVMFNMVTIVNKTMLYILKLLREILIVLTIKKKRLQLCVVMNVNRAYCGDHFTILNHSVVYLKLICYMSIMSQFKQNKPQIQKTNKNPSVVTKAILQVQHWHFNMIYENTLLTSSINLV